eukprot:m.383170 g.383170  ORF g.383170 m.383170 type:complete len:97 (+) comp16728_c0_seq10:2722-3012(+)
MSAFIKLLQIKNKLAALHARDHQASEMIERGQRLKAEVAIKIEAAEAELASYGRGRTASAQDPAPPSRFDCLSGLLALGKQFGSDVSLTPIPIQGG